MRIGYDAKRYFNNKSGLGNYSRDLIRSMEAYFPDNQYVLYTNKVTPNPAFANLEIHTPGNTIINKILPSYWRTRGIVKDLEKDGIRIFHGLSGEIPIGLQKTQIKSVVTIHDLIFIRYPELYKPIDRIIYHKKFLHAARNADKIIAISEQTKRDIVDFFNIQEDRIEVIYQGCHPAFKKPITEEKKQDLIQRYQLPNNFVLNVGSVERRKNALQIVKAMEHLDIPLLIIGKRTPYKDEIQSFISKHRLENKIKFLNVASMDDLAGIYQLADLFVYPSTFEGFGIPIIESLYSGTPVITNQHGVFPEAAGPGSRFVNPDDSDEIAQAIQEIMSSSTLQEKMKNDGLKYAQQFNDDVIACKIEKLYQNLS